MQGPNLRMRKKLEYPSWDYKRLETETVASPQVPVVSQPENSGCLDRTSDVSQSYQLQEAETVAGPQVTVVSQPEISVDRTSAVSQLYRYLTAVKGKLLAKPKFSRI